MSGYETKFTLNTPINSALTSVGTIAVYTSELYVQAGYAVNFGVVIGSVNATGSIVVAAGASFTGSVYLQRQMVNDDASNWRDCYVFTAAGETVWGKEAESCKYRAGCAVGDFKSGTIAIRIGTN